MKLAFVCSGKPDNLKYLKNNCMEVSSVLTSCGWKVIDIYLSDISEFNKRLQEYENETVDEFVFFYTGHGNISSIDRVLKLQLDNMNIRINDILEVIFTYINPKKQAIILDACYSGEFQGVSPKNNIELLSSSSAIEQSHEEDYLEQSIFSYYFVEAIKVSPIPLTLTEIAKYIKSKTDKQKPIPLIIGTTPILFSMRNTHPREGRKESFNENKPYIFYRDGYIEPRTVEIKELSLHVAVCSVTFEEYDLCFNSINKCYAKDYEYKSERKNYPVVNVSWNCANEYIKWLNIKTNKEYSLLSSDEWDYIAQKDKLGEDDFDNYIWHKGNTKNKKIQFVAKKQAGNLGIYDLYGNIHEWCSDRYIRGNAFKYSLNDIFNKIDRIHLPNHTKDVLGFRIALRIV
jgi:hypothetical protein